MSKTRPLSQREVKQQKEAVSAGPLVTLYNPRSQVVSIRQRPPGSDFFISEQTISIRGKHTAKIPKNFLDLDQIKNLQMRGHIKIIGTATT
jgi:hypothetical protein